MESRTDTKHTIIRVAVAIVSALLITLAFYFFLSERMAGGAFVSMLTLGLGLAGIALVWNRVEQFTLFGSEIKLRNLTKDAENMLSSLGESRIALYRIALRLVKRESGEYDNLFDARDGRSADAIDLLREIEKAKLIEELAPEIISALDVIIGKAHAKLLEAPIFAKQEEVPSSDEMVRLYKERPVTGDSSTARQESSMDGNLAVAVEQLRVMLEYRRKASSALPDNES
ncbi:hypothetical protein GCM10027040_29380 [Halomonas shantousis]